MNDFDSSNRKVEESPETSLSLLELAKRREDDAWRRLVEEYEPCVKKWCRESRVPDQDALDIVQEVLQSVARALPTFRRDRPGDRFRHWLRTITARKVSDYRRRMRSEPPGRGGTTGLELIHREKDPHQSSSMLQGGSMGQINASAVPAGLLADALEAVRAKVKAHTWEAFWRTTIDEQCPADVAAELNMSVASVHQSRSRVLKRLRERLGEPPATWHHTKDPDDVVRSMS